MCQTCATRRSWPQSRRSRRVGVSEREPGNAVRGKNKNAIVAGSLCWHHATLTMPTPALAARFRFKLETEAARTSAWGRRAPTAAKSCVRSPALASVIDGSGGGSRMRAVAENSALPPRTSPCSVPPATGLALGPTDSKPRICEARDSASGCFPQRATRTRRPSHLRAE